MWHRKLLKIDKNILKLLNVNEEELKGYEVGFNGPWRDFTWQREMLKRLNQAKIIYHHPVIYFGFLI